MNRVNEAYYNPVGKACEMAPIGREIYRLNGKDNDGVLWEMIVERKSTYIELKSAYPIIENIKV